MSDVERIEQRLAAVERVVVDGDAEVPELATLTSLADDVERLHARLDAFEERLADLEAATEAIDGYVGAVESVNEDVERRAATAVATVDRLERRLDAHEKRLTNLADATGEGDDAEATVAFPEREDGPRRDDAANGRPAEVSTRVATGVDDGLDTGGSEASGSGFQFGRVSQTVDGSTRTDTGEPVPRPDELPEAAVAAIFDDAGSDNGDATPDVGRTDVSTDASPTAPDGRGTDARSADGGIDRGEASGDGHRRPASQEAVARHLADGDASETTPDSAAGTDDADGDADAGGVLARIRSALP